MALSVASHGGLTDLNLLDIEAQNSERPPGAELG